MRALVLSSAVVAWTAAAGAEPQCTIPAAMPATPLVVAVGSDAQSSASPQTPSTDPALPPALRHVAAAGATVTETGQAHGLRTYVARNGDQFTFLNATPDGGAVVAGLISELTPAQLIAAAAGQSRELGVLHGLRGIFVTNGNQFQVFYATPDNQTVIAGAMWDAAGHNLTREQVAPIPGTIQPVGPAAARAAAVAGKVAPALPIIEAAAAGTYGDSGAPKVWMVVDPLCPFSVRALQQLQPLVAEKRLQLAVVPIAINDYENGGRSTPAALSMLSLPREQMVPAWTADRLTGPAAPEAQRRLEANRAAAEAIGLRGTPTLIWRKVDGTEGRSDGVPSDLAGFVASLGG